MKIKETLLYLPYVDSDLIVLFGSFIVSNFVIFTPFEKRFKRFENKIDKIEDKLSDLVKEVH